MPSTSLDWRRSHHQAIRSIPDRVIPTGSLSGLTLSVTRSCPACNDGHQAFPVSPDDADGFHPRATFG
jgi:hypothetical protein